MGAFCNMYAFPSFLSFDRTVLESASSEYYKFLKRTYLILFLVCGSNDKMLILPSKGQKDHCMDGKRVLKFLLIALFRTFC